MFALPNDESREVVFVLKTDGSVYSRGIDPDGYPKKGAMDRWKIEDDLSRIIHTAEFLASDEDCQMSMLDVDNYSISVINGKKINSAFQLGQCVEFDQFLKDLTEQHTKVP